MPDKTPIPAEVRIFDSALLAAAALAEELRKLVDNVTRQQQVLSVALSGGNTPRIFYNYLATTSANEIAWGNVHLFWGDERCVPPDHPESNYHLVDEILLNKIAIPQRNIHRVRGEAKPAQECSRYGEEINRLLPKANNGLPVFDWILLGLGEDGHTASIFPGRQILEVESSICAVATHPRSRQQRITLTLPILNNANRITFLVSGTSKSHILSLIMKREQNSLAFPAARVQPQHGVLEWYIDKAAASLLTGNK